MVAGGRLGTGSMLGAGNAVRYQALGDIKMFIPNWEISPVDIISDLAQ